MGVLLDGYTLDGVIAAKGRVPAIRFRYRPALPEATYEYLTSPRNNGKEAIKRVITLLEKQLESWDVTEKKGDETSSVPITPDTLRRVPHRILEEMINFVTGYSDEEQGLDIKN